MRPTMTDAEEKAYAMGERAAWHALFVECVKQLGIGDVIANAVRDAVEMERDRCAKIVEQHDPADVYLADEGGEERPEKASWDSQKNHVAGLIRDPDHKPRE